MYDFFSFKKSGNFLEWHISIFREKIKKKCLEHMIVDDIIYVVKICQFWKIFVY